MIKSIQKSLLVCIVAILIPSLAWSQEESNWEFNLAPLYLWAIAIDGDLGIRGRTGNVSVEFSDIWDNLEGVFTVRFNGLYRKKYGFVFDYNYLDLGAEKVSDMIMDSDFTPWVRHDDDAEFIYPMAFTRWWEQA